jgi:hypothetical protein
MKGKRSCVICPTLLHISYHTVIPAKAGIQFRNPGFPRIKCGAGLVKPGMTIKVKGLLLYCNRVRSVYSEKAERSHNGIS